MIHVETQSAATFTVYSTHVADNFKRDFFSEGVSYTNNRFKVRPTKI